MAANLPEKIRTPEITRFALRAAQLERVKPIISYWCNYWIVQQILSKGLHTQDQACTEYTTNLMDKLEQVKVENATNDTIQDDVAAQAYVEQFATETFNRAESVMKADKVTAQTADTFKAAATFLDLLSIWGQQDQEIAAKSKYAKYHAVRIAKALKAGEDPNLSNPKPPPAPTVEDMPDAQHREAEIHNTTGDMPNTSAAPAVDLTQDPVVPEIRPSPAISPVVAPVAPGSATVSPYPGQDSPAAPPQHDRSNSIGGGYFPPAPPTFTSDNPEPNLPTAASDLPSAPEPPSSQPEAMNIDPSNYYGVASATQQPPAPLQSPPASVPPAMNPVIPLPQPPHQAAYMPPVQPGPPPGGYRMDEDSVASAQKHAKWAMSALNFEDVNTAVKELRIALEALGAR
ncbi:MAG: hypothetical protein M1820_006813 [Bogoriella megaspora]|nr:MAG: hypothetical protein M1820_006813 [Bogoriella megaspora]